eukprot:Hpha_TRINITY_DN2483_c0_g1::TRINITY_DN2483_c0_g1_i1::g.24623::m.24623/K17914/KIF13; kinesin family member 13
MAAASSERGLRDSLQGWSPRVRTSGRDRSNTFSGGAPAQALDESELSFAPSSSFSCRPRVQGSVSPPLCPLSPPRCGSTGKRGRSGTRSRDSDSVVVAVRLRGFLPRDTKRECVVNFKKSTCMIVAPEHRPPTFKFTFDHCICSTSSDAPEYVDQAALYQQLGRALLDNAWRGLNSSLLAYGQTGSGKTYSIFGPPEVPWDELVSSASRSALHPHAGLVPRIFADLFARLEASEPENYIVEVAMVEIYLERVYDLLARRAHRGVRGTNELGFVVENLTKRRVSNWRDVAEFLKEGNAQKVVAATALNATSSRAHTLLEVYLRKLLGDAQGPPYSAKMTVVDLAGSENVKLSEVVGELSRQASIINLSLMELGKVVEAVVTRGDNRTDKEPAPEAGEEREGRNGRRGSSVSLTTQRKPQHISFRASVLTKLLKESIGGNSKSTLLVTISPSVADVPQTVSALRFADRAKHLRNHAKFNEDAFSDARTHRAIVEEGHRRQSVVARLEREQFELLGRQSLNERAAVELRREERRLIDRLSEFTDPKCSEAIELRRALADLTERQQQVQSTAVALEHKLTRVQSQLDKHGAAMRQLAGAAGGNTEPHSGEVAVSLEVARLREAHQREIAKLSERVSVAEAALSRRRQESDENTALLEEISRLREHLSLAQLNTAAETAQRERDMEDMSRREKDLAERLRLAEARFEAGKDESRQVRLLEREVERLRRQLDGDAEAGSARLDHEAALRQEDMLRHAGERERWRREKRRLGSEVQRWREELQCLQEEHERTRDVLLRVEAQEQWQWERKLEWRWRSQQLLSELHALDALNAGHADRTFSHARQVLRRCAERSQTQLREVSRALAENSSSAGEAVAQWSSLLSLQQHEEELRAERELAEDAPAAACPNAAVRRATLIAEVTAALTDLDTTGASSVPSTGARARRAPPSASSDDGTREAGNDVSGAAPTSPCSSPRGSAHLSPDPRPPPSVPQSGRQLYTSLLGTLPFGFEYGVPTPSAVPSEPPSPAFTMRTCSVFGTGWSVALTNASNTPGISAEVGHPRQPSPLAGPLQRVVPVEVAPLDSGCDSVSPSPSFGASVPSPVQRATTEASQSRICLSPESGRDDPQSRERSMSEDHGGRQPSAFVNTQGTERTGSEPEPQQELARVSAAERWRMRCRQIQVGAGC